VGIFLEGAYIYGKWQMVAQRVSVISDPGTAARIETDDKAPDAEKKNIHHPPYQFEIHLHQLILALLYWYNYILFFESWYNYILREKERSNQRFIHSILIVSFHSKPPSILISAGGIP